MAQQITLICYSVQSEACIQVYDVDNDTLIESIEKTVLDNNLEKSTQQVRNMYVNAVNKYADKYDIVLPTSYVNSFKKADVKMSEKANFINQYPLLTLKQSTLNGKTGKRSGTKAEIVRGIIRDNKGAALSELVEMAVEQAELTPALAKVYVKNNIKR